MTTTSHPDLVGLGACLADDKARAFRSRQSLALAAAGAAADLNTQQAEWAVRAYLRSMRESEPGATRGQEQGR